MKKLVLVALVLAASVVNAAEVKILEADLPRLEYSRVWTDAGFYMDMTSHQGYVKVSVTEERFYERPYDRCWNGPYRYCSPTSSQYEIFNQTVQVDGLMLMNDKVIYHSADGDIDCGTMGVSRVFKRPTLYLSGNCVLSEEIIRTDMGNKIIVTLKTK